MTALRGRVVLVIVSAAFFVEAFTEAEARGNLQTYPSQAELARLIRSDSSRADTTFLDKKRDEAASPDTSGRHLHLGGYTQFRARFYQPEAGENNGADLRRIRVTLNGDLAKAWRYFLQVDFASSPKALDAYVRFSPFTSLVVTAGQFKIPFSRENLNPADKLEFIDRAQVVEALAARSADVIGNQYGRDIGIQMSGGILGNGGRCLLEYAAGIFNGSGINCTDDNNAKDFCGRIVVHPLDGFDIGGSYYNGYDVWGTPLTGRSRTRLGFEFGYVYRSFDLAGEYIAGKDGTVRKEGGYVQAGYFLIRNSLQIAARYDAINSDISASGLTTVNYVFGVNCFFNPAVKLQANYLFRREQTTQIKNDVVEIQLQFSV